MVIMLEENKMKTFGQKLNAGVGRGLEMGGKLMGEYQEKQKQALQYQQENEAAKRLGVDISGIRDPKIRQEVISQALQGKRAEELEKMKQEGKGKLASEKQTFLDQLFGGKQTQEGQSGEPSQENGNFDPSTLSDADIARASSMDPNLGRSLMHAKDVALREKREGEKLKLQQKKTSPEYQRQQHLESSQAQADVKYNQSLGELSRQHELKAQTLNRLESLNKKGVTGKPYEKLLEKSGLIALTSEGRREFAADVKNLITDIKSILGGNFSQAEFNTILNAYPSADFSQEANSAIIRNLKDFQDIKTKEIEFARELKKNNGGKIPEDFQSQVNNMVQEYASSKIQDIKANTREIMNAEYGIPKGHTLLLDPQGEPLSVPVELIDHYLELGASLP